MTNLKICIVVLLSMIFTLSAQNTVVKVVPEQTGPTSIGQNIDIQVRFYNYSSLHGYSIVILFNKAAVQLRSPAASQGDVFASASFHVFLSTPYLDSLKIDDAIFSPAGGEVSGSDALAFTIHFQTVGNGCSDIAIILSKLRDGSNGDLSHTTEDGVITVTSPIPNNSHTEAYEGLQNPDETTFGNTMAKMDFNYTSGGGTVTIAHYETKPPGGNEAPFGPDPEGLISDPVVADRYWELTSSMSSVGSTNYSANVSFSYAGLSGVPKPQLLRVAKRPVSSGATDQWQILSVNDVAVNEIDQEIIIFGLPSSGQYTKDQYTIISGSSDNPLPVELTIFTADITAENYVELKWATETEINNYGFYIEKRAEDETTYMAIPDAFIAGHGNSTITQHYEYIDKQVTPGKWHYRLKQIDYDGNFAYVGEVSIEVKEQNDLHVINDFRLAQNYPNPFNPSTKINFEIPVDYEGLVDLIIYDNLGREVVQLFHGNSGPGNHEVTWNGQDKNGSPVKSGIYYYRLISSEYTLTKKMFLLK